MIDPKEVEDFGTDGWIMMDVGFPPLTISCQKTRRWVSFSFLWKRFRFIVLAKSPPSPAEAAEARRRICTARIRISFDIFVTGFFVVVISNL